jgi:hypothetical protein
MISAIFTISLISDVDLPIFFLFREPLAAGLKKSNPGLGSLYAYICNCEQISMAMPLCIHLQLRADLHGDLLHSLDITDPVAESIDDLNVLDVRDSIPSIAEVLYVVLETLIVLLLDNLQGLSGRRTLVLALEVTDEHGT